MADTSEPVSQGASSPNKDDNPHPQKAGNITNRSNKGEIISQEVLSIATGSNNRSEAAQVTLSSSAKPPQKKPPTKTVTKAKPTITKNSRNDKKTNKSAVKSVKASTKAGKKKVKIKAKSKKKEPKVVAKKPPPVAEPQGPPEEMNALAILAQNFMQIVLVSILQKFPKILVCYSLE